MNDRPSQPNHSSSDSIAPQRMTYVGPSGPIPPSHLELRLSDTQRSYDYPDGSDNAGGLPVQEKIPEDHSLAGKTRLST